MADVPAEKIAALAAEKLTQALQALDVEEIIQAEGSIHQALALVSLLAGPQKSALRDQPIPWGQSVRTPYRHPADATGLHYPESIIAAVRAADEAI